jgi:hypothetical protein
MSKGWDYVAAVDRLRAAVDQEAESCPPEDWPSLASVLRMIASELEARGR